MRKTVRVVFILTSCIMFAMSCNDDIGLGSEDEITPYNIFKGGEWHDQYHGTKISFTENEFTCVYGFSDPETYTGTYKLSYEPGSGPPLFITLSSTEPRVNGKIQYAPENVVVYNSLEDFPADVLYFYPMENRNLVIIGGLFYKQ